MDPEKLQVYLEDIEKQAESILTDRQEIIDLDRRRNSNREALRKLTSEKSCSDRGWICIGNMFLRMSPSIATSCIEKEQSQLNEEIKNLRNNLRRKVDDLNELEGKEKTRGSNLVALDNDEWAAVRQTMSTIQ